MRAIETSYQGYRFRSRLEARWAVFLDSLGIEYWYEHEGCPLATGRGYLPDFYLPALGCWIEVKGPEPTEEEKMKAYMLSLESAFDDPEDLDTSIENSEPVYILYGNIPYPYPKKGNMIGYGVNLDFDLDLDPEDMYGGISGLCWQQCPVCGRFGIGPINEAFCKWCLTAIANDVEERICKLGAWPWDAEELSRSLLTPAPFKEGHKSLELKKAYTAARSARFEWER